MTTQRPNHPLLTGRLPEADEVPTQQSSMFGGTRTIQAPVSVTPREAARVLYRAMREAGRTPRVARIGAEAFLRECRYTDGLGDDGQPYTLDAGAHVLDEPSIEVADLRAEVKRTR